MKLKEYNSLPGFLLRYTILHFKKLHIRIHHILSEDKTPFLHNHPFNFISIILKGYYIEQLLVGDKIKTIKHTRGSIIIRSHKQFHRISECINCTTLFFTWKKDIKWRLKNSDQIIKPKDWDKPKDGMYQRNIKERIVWSKCENSIWFIGNEDINIARNETRYSIHQNIKNIF